jgi:carbon storage regulator
VLSLARRPGQKIRIGEDIILVVREIRGRQVKIGIEAPASVRVLREEIYEEMCAANVEAAAHPLGPETLSKLSASSASKGADRELEFPEGLPGFEGKRFVMIEDSPTVQWLRSVSDPQVKLMILDPKRITLAYEPKPKPAELSPIDGDREGSGIECRVVARTGEQPGQAYLNLFAPILINFSKSLAMQVPLVGSGYGVREGWPAQSGT